MNVRTVFGYLNDQARSSVAKAQYNITKLSKMITSGKDASNYLEISQKGAYVDDHVSSKGLQSFYDGKLKNNRLLKNKLSEMESVLRSLNENVLRDSLKLCMDAKNPAIASSLDSVSLAKQQLESIKGHLNAGFNGHKLFSGSKLNIENVVGDIANTSNIIGGSITANFYNGDSYIASDSISSSQTLSYGITADNSAISKFIAAHHYMISGDFDNAVNLFSEVKTEMGNIIAELGQNSKAIRDQIVSDENHVLRLNEMISSVEDADIADLMSQMKQQEVQLTASFQLAVRISDLSIVNYLR